MLTQNELHQKLYTPLKTLGFTENEIKLYILSLSLGPSPISTLSKHLNISRPNVYKLIRGIEKHGLASFSEGKRYSKKFLVKPPMEISKKLDSKKDEISKMDTLITTLLPDLYALYHQKGQPTNIQILVGEEQYKCAIEEMFSEVKNEVCFFGSIDDFVHSISHETFSSLIESRMKKKLHSRAIMLESEMAQELKKREKEENREIRFLKPKEAFKTSFQLSQNKIIIWQSEAPLALLIEDKYIIQMIQNMFEVIWEITY